MDRYLIALDMDGTLLNSNREISPLTKKYLSTLSAEGHIVCIASGRPFRSIKKYYDEINSSSPSICYNGAYIHSSDNEFEDFTFSFDYHECLQIIDEIGKDNLENVLLENNHKMYLMHEDDILWKYFWLQNIEVAYGDLSQIVDENPVIMIIRAVSQDEKIKNHIQSVINKHPGINLRFWSGLSEFSEIYYEEVSKGRALEKIRTKYNIPLDHVIAFGDALNDTEMLQKAGIGVAMKNSNPTLIKEARYVTEFDNDHDGIYYFLKNIIEG